MEQQPTPGLFYGSALATLAGLLMGLALHGPWEDHSKGSQLWFSSAAAEELARPLTDRDLATDAVYEPADQVTETAYLDFGTVDPNPLPLTRLAPDRYDIKPAAADEPEQVEADALAEDSGDVAAEGQG